MVLHLTESRVGFDIVISAVGDALCMNQPKYMDAAFAGGVRHFYPAECRPSAFHKDSTLNNLLQMAQILTVTAPVKNAISKKNSPLVDSLRTIPRNTQTSGIP